MIFRSLSLIEPFFFTVEKKHLTIAWNWHWIWPGFREGHYAKFLTSKTAHTKSETQPLLFQECVELYCAWQWCDLQKERAKFAQKMVYFWVKWTMCCTQDEFSLTFLFQNSIYVHLRMTEPWISWLPWINFPGWSNCGAKPVKTCWSGVFYPGSRWILDCSGLIKRR